MTIINFDLELARVSRRGKTFVRACLLDASNNPSTATEFDLPFDADYYDKHAYALKALHYMLGGKTIQDFADSTPGVRDAPESEFEKLAKHSRKLGEALGSRLFSYSTGSKMQSDLLGKELTKLIWRLNREKELELRIRLRLGNDPDINNQPWEYLFHSGLYLGASSGLHLVRYNPMGNEPGRLGPPPYRLVIATGAANDPGEQALFREELTEMTNAIADLVNAKYIELVTLPEVSLAEITRVSRTYETGRIPVFHFIGHGNADGGGKLFLSDGAGRTKWVSTQEIGEVFWENKRCTPRLVILNCCHGVRASSGDLFGGSARTLIDQGVSSVIAMQFAVSQRASINLARVFYASIAEGRTIERALTEARIFLRRTNPLEWATPTLYTSTEECILFDMSLDQWRRERQAKRAQIESQIEDRRIELERTRSAAGDSERELATRLARLSEQAKRKHEIQAAKALLDNLIIQKRDLAKTIRDKLESLEQTKAAAEKALAGRISRAAELRQAIDEESRQRELCKTDHQNADKLLQEARNEMHRLAQGVEAALKAKEKAVAEASVNEVRRGSHQEEIARLEDEVRTLDQLLVDELDPLVQAERLARLKRDEADFLRDEIAVAVRKAAEATTRVEELTGTKAQLDKEVERLRQEVIQTESRIAVINQDVERTKNLITQYRDLIRDKERAAEIAEAEAGSPILDDDYKERHREVLCRIAVARAEAQEHLDEIGRLEIQHGHLSSASEELTQKLAHLDEEVRQWKQRRNSLESRLQETRKEVKDHEDRVAKLSGELRRVDDDLSGAKDRIRELQNEITHLSSDERKLKREHDEALQSLDRKESALRSLTREHEEIQGEAEKADEEVRALREQLAQQEESIQELTRQLEATNVVRGTTQSNVVAGHGKRQCRVRLLVGRKIDRNNVDSRDWLPATQWASHSVADLEPVLPADIEFVLTREHELDGGQVPDHLVDPIRQGIVTGIADSIYDDTIPRDEGQDLFILITAVAPIIYESSSQLWRHFYVATRIAVLSALMPERPFPSTTRRAAYFLWLCYTALFTVIALWSFLVFITDNSESIPVSAILLVAVLILFSSLMKWIFFGLTEGRRFARPVSLGIGAVGALLWTVFSFGQNPLGAEDDFLFTTALRWTGGTSLLFVVVGLSLLLRRDSREFFEMWSRVYPPSCRRYESKLSA